MSETQTRVILIERAPPRRALSAWRGRTTKRAVDVDIWDGCMQVVRDRLAEGWRMTRASIDWGPREPLTPRAREQVAREVTECGIGCDLVMTAGSPGRGKTTIELER